jgi:phage baseplate assembly protein W
MPIVSSTGVQIDINVAAVADSVFNILTVAKGELLFNPLFGANLRGFLFENFSQSLATRLSNQIKSQITQWDPRVNVVNIVMSYQNGNILNCTVNFSVKGNPSLFQLTTVIN